MNNTRQQGSAVDLHDELWSCPPGISWHGYLVQLLHIASSIEHALLIQYLYAAYSLGSEDELSAEDLAKLNVWRNLILSIAQEEMGHLLTVQNVLCLLGGQMELVRENYPWDSGFYPFEFHLERLTVGSLALYVYAEMGTEPCQDEFLDVLVKLVEEHLRRRADQAKEQRLFDRAMKIDESMNGLRKRGVHQVGVLYKQIIGILEDSSLIPDSHFHDSSVPFQASMDEWNRGHWREATTEPTADFGKHITEVRETLAKRRQTIAEKKEIAEHATCANVMIETAATRAQAVVALRHIAAQGEGPLFHLDSHFCRLCSILDDFLEYRKKHGSRWEPWTHCVAEDPQVRWPYEPETRSTIIDPISEKWANLFNLRYRMMLTYLSHSFQLARDQSQARLRGAVIHKVFSEMYNLKAIAGILVQLPLKPNNDKPRAGPPFQMPYTLAISMDPIDRWRLHLDLIEGTRTLNLYGDLREHTKLSPTKLCKARAFLEAMQELDEKSVSWLRQVIAGLTPAGGSSQ